MNELDLIVDTLYRARLYVCTHIPIDQDAVEILFWSEVNLRNSVSQR